MAHTPSDPASSDTVDFTTDYSVTIPEGREWPDRLRRLSETLRNPRDEADREEARIGAWKILTGAICLYVRIHGARLGRIRREDREDLAAEKSLDLLRKLESGATDFSHRSPAEIASFISKVSKNGLIDHLRRDRRRVEPDDEERESWDLGADGGSAVSTAVSPDVEVERKEFVRALRGCVERLDPRSRLCWFFRVFYGMVSNNIAAHPRVRIKASHVDVVLQRSRNAIRDCMRGAGFGTQEIPPGTFVELWRAFRLEGV